MIDNIWGDNPSTTAPQSSQISEQQPAFNDDTWGDSPSTTVPESTQISQQQSTFNKDVWGFNEPTVPLIKPPPRVERVSFVLIIFPNS